MLKRMIFVVGLDAERTLLHILLHLVFCSSWAVVEMGLVGNRCLCGREAR